MIIIILVVIIIVIIVVYRFLSLSIQREGDSVACLALTNPSEVVIVARDGANGSYQEVGRYGDKLMVRS